MARLTTVLLVILTLGLIGCDNDCDTVGPIDKVPTTPQGVYSVTGDGAVYLYWYGIYETDVHHYVVYRSFQETTGYNAIANVAAQPNPDLDLLIYEYVDYGRQNGVKYWYAVTAVDHAGQESELSAENVFDTPRPDGDATLLPNDIAPTASGFNLSAQVVVGWDSPAADIWVDRVVDTIDQVIYMDVFINAGWYTDGQTDIQDMGYTSDFDEIGWAPDGGWSLLGFCEALEDHTYVVWTADDHYAKVRITSISPSGAVSFQWAYQTVPSEFELAPPARPPRDGNEPPAKRTVVSQLIK